MSDDLNSIMKTMKAKYGDNVVTTGKEVASIRKIPLGIPSFDYVTTGGIPINRITELYGDFSSLKSYFCYKALARFQRYDWANEVPDVITKVEVKAPKKGEYIPSIKKITTKRGYAPEKEPRVKYCVLFDIEGTYDPVWGKHLGIDNDILIHLNLGSMNVAIDLLEVFLSHPDVSMVVLDSMSIVGADMEIDASMEKEQMGANARFWNKATRKIMSSINRNPEKDITFIAINSSYEAIGVMFGNPEKVKNGKQFSLAKSMSIKCSALKTIEEKTGSVKRIVGRNITLRNKKNKVGIPFREASLYYSFVDDEILNVGDTDITSQLVNLGLQKDFIERKGAYYSFKDFREQGFDNFCSALVEDKKALKELRDLVYAEVINC